VVSKNHYRKFEKTNNGLERKKKRELVEKQRKHFSLYI